jgi:homopolymeric O-antigen transport system ATP-binding protein
MSNIAIRCEGLGKQYRIGERERYRALRDTITDTVKAPFRRLRSTLGGAARAQEKGSQTFWALKDLSFEVKRGEVVGVIGRNGAGKSTLLKILSRITSPTAGEVAIRGRVGSLLEVGTGFHPELTGRENIYLNGAILGMKRAEITRKFDEIVAFAGIEKFIDTPVKRYSSGMYVRLAFGVAVHLEPDILVIDEVLAVGDAEFQRKCLYKMQEIGKTGRTIILVSHNMSAVRSICDTAFVLDKGKIISHGEINRVVDSYLAEQLYTNTQHSKVETESFSVDNVKIYSLNSSVIRTFDSVNVQVSFTAKTYIADPGLYIGFLNSDGQRLAGLDFKDFRTVPPIPAGQKVSLGFSISSFPLLHGAYQLEIHLKDMAEHKFEFINQPFGFEVIETPIYGGRKLDRWFGSIAITAQAIAEES